MAIGVQAAAAAVGALQLDHRHGVVSRRRAAQPAEQAAAGALHVDEVWRSRHTSTLRRRARSSTEMRMLIFAPPRVAHGAGRSASPSRNVTARKPPAY